jgi:hypothetical protein
MFRFSGEKFGEFSFKLDIWLPEGARRAGVSALP